MAGSLALSALTYLCVLVDLFAFSGRVVDLPDVDFVGELNARYTFVYIYNLLGFFPVMFCIILINYIVEIMSNKINVILDDKKELLFFFREYLNYRNLLQVCLLTLEIILSLNAIIFSAFLSIWREVGQHYKTNTFPSQVIIIYGLMFTLLLILICVPTYFNLTNVG